MDSGIVHLKRKILLKFIKKKEKIKFAIQNKTSGFLSFGKKCNSPLTNFFSITLPKLAARANKAYVGIPAFSTCRDRPPFQTPTFS